MSDKRKVDRPLLAGRLRPYRRPPRPANGPALRLNHGDRAATRVAPPSLSIHAALERGERIAGALHAALECYGRIVAQVGIIDQQIRRILDAENVAAIHAAWVVEVRHALTTIDHDAATTTAEGRVILDGTWSDELLDATGRVVALVRLPRIASDSLGSDSIGGRLAALQSPAERDVLKTQPAVALAIVRSAAFWLAGERERVFRLLAEVIEPLVAELEVMEANAGAAQAAADLSTDLAHVTKLDALAAQNTASRGISSSRPTIPSPFRIRHAEDDA